MLNGFNSMESDTTRSIHIHLHKDQKLRSYTKYRKPYEVNKRKTISLSANLKILEFQSIYDYNSCNT